jgi:hypothetical protein
MAVVITDIATPWPAWCMILDVPWQSQKSGAIAFMILKFPNVLQLDDVYQAG